MKVSNLYKITDRILVNLLTKLCDLIRMKINLWRINIFYIFIYSSKLKIIHLLFTYLFYYIIFKSEATFEKNYLISTRQIIPKNAPCKIFLYYVIKRIKYKIQI